MTNKLKLKKDRNRAKKINKKISFKQEKQTLSQKVGNRISF